MKTVLITGAIRGIGKATAMLFAKNGWRVALHYHNSEVKAASLRDSMRALGYECEIFKAEISDRAQVFEMLDNVLGYFGTLDAVVANAGIAQQKLFTDITDEDWDNMMGVNAKGVFNVCQAALPHMISKKCGKIVTVSSIWGICGASCEVHYSASKAAVIGLTKALAKEVGPSKINVNCVAPGVTDTDMCADFSPDDMQALSDETPLEKIGKPLDMANTIYFLCTEQADFITGQVISPNGGLVI